VLDTVFVFCAVAGGAALVLRMGLMLLGIGAESVFDDPGSLDGHGDVGTRLLSIQGISAFLVMFGLAGLAVTRQGAAPAGLAVPVAFAAGVGSMWVIARIFQLMGRLQSSGTLDLSRAIGREGVVYLTIHPGSGGQIQLELLGRLGTFDAQSATDVEIATGRRVRVVAVRGGTLVVEPAEPAERAALPVRAPGGER
jgi:membrane protein implicated in regulation of membrane protease activity